MMQRWEHGEILGGLLLRIIITPPFATFAGGGIPPVLGKPQLSAQMIFTEQSLRRYFH